MPTGHLHTFEFHKERSEKAREEFHQHGHASCVTVTHRDVCGEGFQLDHIVDAVFLDLPKPWECISSAKKALKKQGELYLFVVGFVGKEPIIHLFSASGGNNMFFNLEFYCYTLPTWS